MGVLLVLGAPFNHAWTKLGQVLPQLEFDIKDEIIGRGVRELKYRPAGAKVGGGHLVVLKAVAD